MEIIIEGILYAGIFGIVLIITISCVIIYGLWCLIKSAVKKGTLEALFEYDRITKRIEQANREYKNNNV